MTGAPGYAEVMAERPAIMRASVGLDYEHYTTGALSFDYERLLADLRGAALAIRTDDIETKSDRLQRANDVIFELLSSLDRHGGGEVSERLAALYTYMISRLGEVGRTMDAAILDELAGHAESLLSAWRSVAHEHVHDEDAQLPDMPPPTGSPA